MLFKWSMNWYILTISITEHFFYVLKDLKNNYSLQWLLFKDQIFLILQWGKGTLVNGTLEERDIIRRIKKLVGDTGHFFSGNQDILLSGNRTTYPLGIRPLIIWDLGHFPGKGDILSSGNDFILWESDHLSSGNLTTYPLGIWPLIHWESDHLSSGNRDILWETGRGKRDTLSAGNRTTYPLGIILWESVIREMKFNQ